MAEQRVQRRLAAILAADMVGYSRLMGADEEGTIARQKTHRTELIDPEIASHGGRIVKTMGDGLLVEFASVVDAVKCAIAVQNAMSDREADVPEDRRIQYRVGINLGDIVIDGDDILGDGVNVAARLEGEADAGGICISGDAYRQVHGKIDYAFEDLGERSLKNIAEPVRAYQVLLSGVPAPAFGAPQLTDKPSIAVLPFDNMSGDPEQEYFSDGMAEDLITDLSKIPSLSVAARNSSFSFKGQMPDIKDVVEKLSVAFVLEGSVRRMGDRLRINTQLIDSADGRHIWAERYDGDMAEIFEFQDAIREQIVSALQVSLTPADKVLSERKPTDSVEAYDLYLKGRANLHRFEREQLLEAINCLEEAIEIDPNFADAYGYLSMCHLYGWIGLWSEFDDNLQHALELAERGVALDGKSAIALTRLGWVQTFLVRFDQAVPNFENSVALAPNNAEVYADFGQVLNYWGDPKRGLEMLEKALSLETFAPPLWNFNLGRSYWLLHQYDEALVRFKQMVERSPSYTPAYVHLACAYVELDRLDDARAAIKTALEITPQLTLKQVAARYPYRLDEVRNRFLDSLRKAGLSEGNEAQDTPPPLPDKPSIAVLPFDNLSGDPEQEYFSDGMAGDLITDISNISSLFVIARNSSFAFKGKAMDVKEIAAKLGVGHILEGSVRKMGDKLRVNAQLVDAASGGHIWAQRYDGDMADIFEFQDSIREQIVSAMQVSLTPTDKALSERRQTDSVEAYDLFLKGRENFYRYTHEHALEAIKCLEAAIEIDPNFADAYGYLSFCHYLGWGHLWPEFDDTLDRANELAEKGVALDATSAFALARLAWIQTHLRRYDRAIANLEEAIALAPNNGEVYATFGQVLNYWGDAERALKMLEKAFSLETFAPAVWEYQVGHSHFLLRQYDEALTLFNRALERAPKILPAHVQLACAYVELDRLDDARETITTVLEIAPLYTVKEVARIFPYRTDEDRNRILDGLRKGGLPEGDEVEDTSPPLPDKPSIAVLPFENLSGDPEQEYFADGLAEDIITGLSRFHWFFVIARNSSFVYKGKAVDVKQIAHELGVQYILEGSVRKAGNRVRIAAQLIDAPSGHHVWAERYDRDLEDIFAVQDEITEAITGAVAPSFIQSEVRRAERKTPGNLDAWDYTMRGYWRLWRLGKADIAEARRLFEVACELDPTSATAYSGLAQAWLFEVYYQWAKDPREARASALKAAQQAVALDGGDAWAQTLLGFAYMYMRKPDDGVTACRQALDLNPNLAFAEGILACCHAFRGDYDDAVTHAERAERLSPRDPQRVVWYQARAHAALGTEQYEEAAIWAKKSIEASPEMPAGWRVLASCYGHLGRIEEATTALQEVLRLYPDLTIESIRASHPSIRPEHVEIYVEGLRKAGLPEG